jgi:hypothetical protein
MTSYARYMDMLGDKASGLKQKASPLQGKIRAEIRALKAKPGPDTQGRELLTDLSSLKTTVKRVHKGTIINTAKEVLERVEEAEKELELIDEMINSEVLEVYSYIIANGYVPNHFLENMTKLFTRWENVQASMDVQKNHLTRLADELDEAEGICDAFSAMLERRTRELVVFLGRSEPGRKSGFAEMDGDGSNISDLLSKERSGLVPPESSVETHFTADYFKRFAKFGHLDLMELSHMLRGIATLYVLGRGRALNVSSCCSRAVAHTLMNTRPLVPERYHDSRAMGMLKADLRRVLRKHRAFDVDPIERIIAFSQVLFTHNSVMSAIPEEVKEKERGFVEKVNSFCADFMEVQDRSQGSAIDSLERASEFAERFSEAFEGHEMPASYKIFLLEAASGQLGSMGFSLDANNAIDVLEDEEKLGFLAQLSTVLGPSVYTSSEVFNLVNTYGLPKGILGLIQPLNYLLEHPEVRQKTVFIRNVPYLQPDSQTDLSSLSVMEVSSVLDLHPIEVALLPRDPETSG